MRPQDWPEQLDAYLQACATKPFEWSVFDCATFVAEWRRMMTGAEWAPPYCDTVTAAAFMQCMGGIRGAAAAILGDPMAKAAKAGRGDIVIVEHNGRESLGIVRGADVVGPGEFGLMAIKREHIVMAWGVDA